MSDSKYKLFRNYMVNELGISREDIKEWTIQSINETVEKILRGIKIDDLARDIVLARFDYFYKNSCITHAVEKIVRERLDFEITIKESKDG